MENHFQLPAETNLHHVRLRTGNLDRAIDFYQRVIGLKILERHSDTVSLSAAESQTAILILTADASAVRRPLRATGLYHLAIRYPTRRELAHSLVRLVAANCSISGGSDHQFGASIYLDDHDGNGVELYFDLPRPQWPLRQDKLFILTGNNPLNFDRLLASVEGEEPQLQAPSGTDLGHLNLHVPDLVEAEQFYRDVLSFEMTAHIGPGGRFLATGGYHHQIAINNWSGKNPAPENAIGLISYRFTVPDAKTLLTLEERAKARHHQTRWAGDILQIRDPNGNWIEFETLVPVTRENADRR